MNEFEEGLASCIRCKDDTDFCVCAFTEVQRNEFSFKQSYDTETAKTLICMCGNDKFLVGQGSHLTVLKCPLCNFEQVVHDG